MDIHDTNTVIALGMIIAGIVIYMSAIVVVMVVWLSVQFCENRPSRHVVKYTKWNPEEQQNFIDSNVIQYYTYCVVGGISSVW